MSKYIVDIKGEIEGDYEIIGKYEERPQGEWLDIYSSHIAYECSNCHLQLPITDYYNFCPNCGADMRGGAE